MNANIDYRISERNGWRRSFFFATRHSFLLCKRGANVPGFGADSEADNRLLAIHDSHSFSSTTVNEARVGYNLIRGDSFGRNPHSRFGTRNQKNKCRRLSGSRCIRIGARANQRDIARKTQARNVDRSLSQSSTTLADVLSINRGEHSFRLGGEILFYQNRITTNNNRRGQVIFQTFNNFLLGQANNSTYGDGIGARTIRASDYSLFFQDDWKLSPKFTLNLGIRYELDLPPYEKHGALSTFDPALYQPRMVVDGSGNPVGPPLGGFVQPGNVIPQYDLPDVPNVGKRVLHSVDPNNFAPRIGFAYSPLEAGDSSFAAAMASSTHGRR